MLLGVEANTTTAYHPQANGMVERLHRQLKASLKARTTGANWFDELPMVLLGIRSSRRVDPGCSPAELVYGSTLRIPGEFLQPREARAVEPDLPFLRQLQQSMRSIQPPPPRFHGTQTAYVPANLASADYVYVRPAATSSLTPSTDNPITTTRSGRIPRRPSGILKPAGKCFNGILKWLIIGGVVGLVGLAGILVGLHLSGNLSPETEKVNENSLGTVDGRNSAASMGGNFPDKTTNSAANVVGTAIVASSDPIKDVMTEVADNAVNAAAGAADAVADVAANVADVLGDAAESAGDLWGDMVDDVYDDFGDSSEGLEDMAETIKDAVEDNYDDDDNDDKGDDFSNGSDNDVGEEREGHENDSDEDARDRDDDDDDNDDDDDDDNDVGGNFGDIADQLREILEDTVGGMGDMELEVGDGQEAMIEGVEDMEGGLEEGLGGVFEGMDSFPEDSDEGQPDFEGIGQDDTFEESDGLSDLSEELGGIGEGLLEKLGQIGARFKEMGNNIGEGLSEQFNDISESIGETGDGLAGFNDHLESISEGFGGMAEGFGDALDVGGLLDGFGVGDLADLGDGGMGMMLIASALSGETGKSSLNNANQWAAVLANSGNPYSTMAVAQRPTGVDTPAGAGDKNLGLGMLALSEGLDLGNSMELGVQKR
ncbi:hypothetical protein RRG08_023162 [Elysia crispata]|uniref:Integrase catalytic domain-containing protein n=1 Tax=Elysia crispata TaxID=231223 RepID=A0AAE0XN67_9GAST|nr:hypothetical protein RRG08_023162 [Elysia crispata]